MDEIITVEKYEWMIYIYSGIALTTVGLCLLITLIVTEQPSGEGVIPAMIAAMVCLIMSLYFYSEGYNIKEGLGTSTDIYVGSDQ